MASAAAITPHTLASPRVSISVFAAVRNSSGLSMSVGARRVPGISVLHSQRRRMVAAAATATEMPPAARGEKTFSEEMRAAAMRLHTKDQAKEGEKEPEARSAIGREPIVEGYLHYLVDSKLLFQTLENIVDRAVIPCYAEFQNTGLERSEALKKDLKWFSDQGHTIPKPSSPGTTYASYIEELSEKNPQAFICHFYNVYFAHSAGGQKVGKKIAENILNKKELEFYKWEGTLTQMLQNVCTKINQVASSWSQEEKNHCLEETEKSFTYLMDCLRQIDIQPERIQ